MAPSLWPWWLASLVLTGASLLHWRLVGRLMGGSGAFITLVNLREELRVSREEAGLADDAEAMRAAMLAATLAEFPDAVAQGPGQEALPPAPVDAPRGRSPWTAHLVFLGSLALGGTVATVARPGRWTWQTSLGPTFEQLYGQGPGSVAVLLVGGLLAGFGARMAGGCTVGHGLNGCSRLQRGSLATMIVFFGVAVAASLGLSRLTGVR